MERKRSALVLTVVALGLVLPLAVTSTPVRREARSPEKNLEDTAVSTFNVTARLSEATGSGDGSGTNTTSQPPAVSLAGTGYITNGTKEISDSHEVRIKLIQSSTVPPETPHPQVLPVKSEDVPALPIPLDDQGNDTILTSLGSSNESVEVEPPVQNCSEVLEYDSLIPVLKCPNVKAFHNALQKEPLKQRGSVNVEIERVDGALFLSSATGLVLMCLNVNNANITAITLQDKQPQMLQSLKSLDLSDNPTFDAKSLNALGRLPSLTHLYLRGTALSSLELQLPELLQNLPNLQYLDLSSSGIHHLSESTSTQNMKLNHLDVSGNRLFHVTLSEVVVSQLKHLNMSGCGLRNIRVMESPAVRTTPLKVHQNLRVLDVSDNLLTDLPRLLLNNLAPECVVLDITKNSWSHACNKCSLYYLWQYLTTLPEDASKCSEIKGMEDVLCFNRNEALLTCGWDDCPKGCQCDKWKKIVDCIDIGLESIPLVGPSSAEVLLVQFNNLQNLSGIESPSWCNLKHLHADRNRITTLLPPGINGSCSCKSEDHYDDQRTCFPLNLKELVLNNNTLQSVTSTDCSILYPLQTLKLARNMVNSPVAQVCGSLENLKVLDLSHNNLTNFYEPDFASYPHLKKLIVHHNKLTHLQPDVTSLMHELQFLDLSHNSLENIHDHFSAPDTIFSDMGSSNLKELLLHNNKLSSVKYVLSLTVIPSLTKVTLHDNPWDCNCSNIGQLKDNIFVKKNTPLYEAAMEDMECKTPYENERMAVSDLLNEECRQGSTDQLFMTSMACFLILCICILICYSRQWKYCYGRCKPGYNASQPAVTRRKYDCFVVSSSRDFELLRQNVIIPLTQRGYSIAWHDNAFRPGYWIMDNVERAVRNSARMLVFATDNLVTSRWGRQEIRRGRHEEFSCSDYKIMALVTETLPRELNRDLYEIVALRTHVLLSDRDYIDQICNFLPQPAPFANRPDGVYMTDSNIQALLQKYEELKQMKRQENTPISELFHTHHEQNRVTINVDIATVSNSSMCSAAEQEKRSNVIQRFKVSPVAALPSPPASSDTTSLKYCLVDQDNDDDMNDIELGENFERRTYKRISCRF